MNGRLPVTTAGWPAPGGGLAGAPLAPSATSFTMVVVVTIIPVVAPTAVLTTVAGLGSLQASRPTRTRAAVRAVGARKGQCPTSDTSEPWSSTPPLGVHLPTPVLTVMLMTVTPPDRRSRTTGPAGHLVSRSMSRLAAQCRAGSRLRQLAAARSAAPQAARSRPTLSA